MSEIEELQQAILAIQQTIQELDQKVEDLASAGKYDEADKIQKKIVVEKQKLTEKRKEQISIEQQEKQIQLQTAFTQMAMKFQNEWDEEIKKFEIESAAQIEDVNHRHAQELQALRETLEEEPRIPYKPSSELVTLRTTEKQLAKLKKFQEALRAKAAADQLEQTERQRYGKDEDNRRESLVKQLELQQSNEKTALLKKIDRDRKDKTQQRESDNSRLEQRYRNLLRDQRNEQRQKTNQFERDLLVVHRKEDGMYLSAAVNRPTSNRSSGSSSSRSSLGATGNGGGASTLKGGQTLPNLGSSGRIGSRPSSSVSSSPTSPSSTISSSRFFSSTGSSSTNSQSKSKPTSSPSKKT